MEESEEEVMRCTPPLNETQNLLEKRLAQLLNFNNADIRCCKQGHDEWG